MEIVYILTNESMSDIVKIGITDDLSRRLRELDNTSAPLPFECFYAVEVDNARAIESLLHETFDDKRIRQNREFFNCTPKQAKSALKIAEIMGGKDVTVVFETEQDKQALDKEAVRKRQMEGIKRAKERGVYKGRKRSIDVERVRQMREEGQGATAIARHLGIDRTSVYRVLKDYQIQELKRVN